MKKSDSERILLLGFALVFSAVGSSTASEVRTNTSLKVVRQEFLSHPFGSKIADIGTVPVQGANRFIVICQNQATFFDNAKSVEKVVPFRTCSDPEFVVTTSNTPVVFCQGGGFSSVCVTDLSGKEHWCYSSSDTVLEAIHVPPARFIIRMASETAVVLDESGKETYRINEHWQDEFVGPSGQLITILSKRNAFGGTKGISIDWKNAQLQTIKSVPVGKEFRRIVAADWPSNGDVALATEQELVILKSDQSMTRRVKLGSNAVMSANGAVFKDNSGEEFLGIACRHSSRTGNMTFLILSKQLDVIHEETLATSYAITTLGTSNRLYVGVGARSIVEYQVEREASR